MNLFTKSDGSKVKSSKEFESGGDFTLIPDNTDLLVCLEKAEWAEPGDFDKDAGPRLVNIKWNVISPKEYANRKVFQKIKPFHEKSEKADKAKEMLAAIDANAGGKLAGLETLPTDEDFARALSNKLMVIKMGVYGPSKKNPDMKEGNWVKAVSPRKAGDEKKQTAPKVEPMDDDIPF
jgi:hypothetical protein